MVMLVYQSVHDIPKLIAVEATVDGFSIPCRPSGFAGQVEPQEQAILQDCKYKTWETIGNHISNIFPNGCLHVHKITPATM